MNAAMENLLIVIASCIVRQQQPYVALYGDESGAFNLASWRSSVTCFYDHGSVLKKAIQIGGKTDS